MGAQSGRRTKLSGLPTAGGGITRAAFARAIAAGFDAKPLLRQAGLSVEQVANPHNRIAVHNQIAFLNLVANELEEEFLGIELARQVDLRELGLLYYVQASSDTLGDALRRVARYASIQNEGVGLDLRVSMNATMGLNYLGVARLSDCHQIEFFITLLVRIWRQLTSRRLSPLRVNFMHRRAAASAKIRAFFGCDFMFGQNADEIVFPASIVSVPIISADPFLNSLLLKYCDQALANRRKKSGSWRLRVENAIAPLLPHGQAQIAQICRSLGVSRRTLVRRLTAERCSFSQILDDLKRELAKRYLQEPDLPVSEMAWLLGYSDTSAFDHAFRRWTGKTPSQARG